MSYAAFPRERQQVSSFMLRLGRHYPGKKTWARAHMNWLMLQKLPFLMRGKLV
jgi:hypothetical protein